VRLNKVQVVEKRNECLSGWLYF